MPTSMRALRGIKFGFSIVEKQFHRAGKRRSNKSKFDSHLRRNDFARIVRSLHDFSEKRDVSDPVRFLEEESSSVLRRSCTIGDLSSAYVSLRPPFTPSLSRLLSPPEKEGTPPYGPFLAAVCKYEGREGSSSSRTTDRGASYRIPPPFVFAIRDYVTTMIHDDIYFGISSDPAPLSPSLSLFLLSGYPRGRSLSSRATRSFRAATRAR